MKNCGNTYQVLFFSNRPVPSTHGTPVLCLPLPPPSLLTFPPPPRPPPASSCPSPPTQVPRQWTCPASSATPPPCAPAPPLNCCPLRGGFRSHCLRARCTRSTPTTPQGRYSCIHRCEIVWDVGACPAPMGSTYGVGYGPAIQTLHLPPPPPLASPENLQTKTLGKPLPSTQGRIPPSPPKTR